MKQGIKRFFKYARARHQIYLDKMNGGPVTKDPILYKYSFTNVFRELDKTTVWFRENVRDRLKGKPEVLLATVVFRLLNRIEVGEAIFCQQMLPLGRFKKLKGPTAWDAFLASGDVGVLKHAIITSLPRGPHATGAYIISSPPGYTKLDGILEVIRRFMVEKRSRPESLDRYIEQGWREIAAMCLANPDARLEAVWGWLKQFDYFGPFHSYEIVTDLRFTSLLERAPDITTWANPGPGARRGANRVHGRDKKDKSVRRDGLISEMRELLELSKDMDLWPQYLKSGWHGPKDTWSRDPVARDAWPAWEMRDVEHTLCEFDKYERVRLGEGRPRGVYR